MRLEIRSTAPPSRRCRPILQSPCRATRRSAGSVVGVRRCDHWRGLFGSLVHGGFVLFLPDGKLNGQPVPERWCNVLRARELASEKRVARSFRGGPDDSATSSFRVNPRLAFQGCPRRGGFPT